MVIKKKPTPASCVCRASLIPSALCQHQSTVTPFSQMPRRFSPSQQVTTTDNSVFSVSFTLGDDRGFQQHRQGDALFSPQSFLLAHPPGKLSPDLYCFHYLDSRITVSRNSSRNAPHRRHNTHRFMAIKSSSWGQDDTLGINYQPSAHA